MKYYFCIVARDDTPVYETALSAPGDKSSNRKEDLIQFIIHAALDNIEQKIWTNTHMVLKNVDKFNEDYISAFTTAGHVRFLLLHDARLDEGAIKTFFYQIYESYLKIMLNPFYQPGHVIQCKKFDVAVKLYAANYLKLT